MDRREFLHKLGIGIIGAYTLGFNSCNPPKEEKSDLEEIIENKDSKDEIEISKLNEQKNQEKELDEKINKLSEIYSNMFGGRIEMKMQNFRGAPNIFKTSRGYRVGEYDVLVSQNPEIATIKHIYVRGANTSSNQGGHLIGSLIEIKKKSQLDELEKLVGKDTYDNLKNNGTIDALKNRKINDNEVMVLSINYNERYVNLDKLIESKGKVLDDISGNVKVLIANKNNFKYALVDGERVVRGSPGLDNSKEIFSYLKNDNKTTFEPNTYIKLTEELFSNFKPQSRNPTMFEDVPKDAKQLLNYINKQNNEFRGITPKNLNFSVEGMSYKFKFGDMMPFNTMQVENRNGQKITTYQNNLIHIQKIEQNNLKTEYRISFVDIYTGP